MTKTITFNYIAKRVLSSSLILVALGSQPKIFEDMMTGAGASIKITYIDTKTGADMPASEYKYPVDTVSGADIPISKFR